MKLGWASLRRQIGNASLTTRFAVYSFVCIALMTAALWLLVSNYLIAQILDREWLATAQIVRADVRKFLEEYDFTAKDRKSVGHKFVTLLDHMRLTPEIVRFRVYNSKGVVIWSDDRSLVGKSFAEKPEIQNSLAGRVVANRSTAARSERGIKSKAAVVEVYVPIYSDNNRDLLGVFETHRGTASIVQAVAEARAVVLIGALGGGLLLYLALFAIVRRAAQQIEEQKMNLVKIQSQLVASQRMAAVGEMAAAVAHGIGNPLSSIRAAAQVALLEAEAQTKAGADGKMTETLQSIMRQVDRVQKRMQGLLNFAKPLEPHAVPLEVNEVLRDVAETLRPRFNNAEVMAHLELDESLPKVFSDAGHLEQVFMGLITNALEATPRGGRVTVRTRAVGNSGDGRGVRVFIEDTGEGIPVENRDRVFEPFFTTKPHGTGIGLPLAKKFVERNGGSIKICDVTPPGTRIEVTLPAAM
jgi:two-component system, NtrC family, sensor histidine kinase HydH